MGHLVLNVGCGLICLFGIGAESDLDTALAGAVFFNNVLNLLSLGEDSKLPLTKQSVISNKRPFTVGDGKLSPRTRENGDGLWFAVARSSVFVGERMHALTLDQGVNVEVVRATMASFDATTSSCRSTRVPQY